MEGEDFFGETYRESLGEKKRRGLFKTITSRKKTQLSKRPELALD